MSDAEITRMSAERYTDSFMAMLAAKEDVQEEQAKFTARAEALRKCRRDLARQFAGTALRQVSIKGTDAWDTAMRGLTAGFNRLLHLSERRTEDGEPQEATVSDMVRALREIGIAAYDHETYLKAKNDG